MILKKTATFLILAAMLTGIVSCGSEVGGTVTTDGGDKTDTTTVPEDTEIHDDLPELDFGGDKFTILVEDYGGYCGADFWVEESDGDVVNDAIYNRNRKVSERLNLDLDWVMFTHSWDDRNEFTTKFRSGVLAGDGSYDLAAGLGYFMPSFVSDGILSDMSTLPYIDPEKPWWSEKFMKASSIDGKYYFVTGDASLGLIMSATPNDRQVGEPLTAESDKLSALFETYLKLGGIQLQPDYLSAEDLKDAQIHPENWCNLRVRITGFTGFFTKFDKASQDEIIRRTEQ